MYCVDCASQWPGHTKCPECDQPLVSLDVYQAELHVDALPQFDDLKAFFRRGKESRLKQLASSQQRDEE